jgi:hypothetical protein
MPLKERFHVIKIPLDANIYKVDDENGYELLFENDKKTQASALSETNNQHLKLLKKLSLENI